VILRLTKKSIWNNDRINTTSVSKKEYNKITVDSMNGKYNITELNDVVVSVIFKQARMLI